jgi:superfamily I DNA/RNA helicase
VDVANWLIQHEVDREPKQLVSVTEWDGEVHLVRFANQTAEAAGLARLIKAEIDAGTEPESILVLAKSDPKGWLVDALRDQLKVLEERIYHPRGSRGPRDDDLQRLVAYLVLSAALATEKPPDDLALRTLIDLEKNGIGWTRLWRVIKHAIDNGIRFHKAVEACADGGLGGNLTAVATAGEAILDTARGLAPTEDESFDEWLVRVTESLDVPEDEYTYVLELSREVSGEVAELEITLDESSEDADASTEAKQIQPENFLPELLAVLANPSDVMPPSQKGAVTFTTMHGAKGLTADVVFVLQAEDEVIPGAAVGSDLDEARRLLYVSLTRAKKKLVITACQHRVGSQRYVGQEIAITRHLTRFLMEYGLEGLTIAQYLERASD